MGGAVGGGGGYPPWGWSWLVVAVGRGQVEQSAGLGYQPARGVGRLRSGARVDLDGTQAVAGVIDGLDADDEHGVHLHGVLVGVVVVCDREHCVDRFVEQRERLAIFVDCAHVLVLVVVVVGRAAGAPLGVPLGGAMALPMRRPHGCLMAGLGLRRRRAGGVPGKPPLAPACKVSLCRSLAYLPIAVLCASAWTASACSWAAWRCRS